MRPDIKGLHHDHVDGSAALADVILDLYALAKKDFPFPTIDAWRAFFQDPHEDIVKRFSTVTSVLQTEGALAVAGYAYGRARAREGYAYVEARFAPQYHVFGGLTVAQAVAAMRDGLREAEREFGIRILPMVSIGRETDAETGVAIARVALSFGGEVALDLACDEALHPPEKHAAAFALTRGTRVRRTCHAGEWVAKRPTESYRARLLANVRTAVRVLQADGIGHAIPLADDPELIREIVDRGVRVEGCPLSNLSCGAIADVRELRIGELLDAGVLYTLNADDDLFLPTMDRVLDECERTYAFTAAQKDALEKNVFRAAFAADVRTKPAP
jgi:adenosine deaminase